MPVTILLIDDSPAVCDVLSVGLESEGYRVLDAADGKQGVRLYREHRPAFVLADIVMPEKDGLETVREVFAITPTAVIASAMLNQRDHGAQVVAAETLARVHLRENSTITVR